MFSFFFVGLTVFLVYYISPWRTVRGPRPGGGAAACEARVPALAAAWHCSLLAHQLQHCSAAPPPAGRGITAVRPHLHRTSCRGQGGSVCTGAVWTLETDHRCKPESTLVCRHDNETALIGELNGHSLNQYDDELCMSSAARSLSREENLIKAQMQ